MSTGGKKPNLATAQLLADQCEEFDVATSPVANSTLGTVAMRLRAAARRFPITFYVAITFAWSWTIWMYMAVSGLGYQLRLWKCLYVAGLSGPLVSAVCVTFIAQGTAGVRRLIGRIFVWKLPADRYLTAIFLAPALLLAGTGLYSLLFRASIKFEPLTVRMALVSFAWMVVRGGPVNEEIGWRGFLLPELLNRYNPFWASLILLPVWAGWHLPLWRLPGLPHQYWPFPYFLMLIAPITFLFTWLHLRSRGSVLIAILFHASINTTIHLLPLLPPRFPGLGPFAFWIAMTWVIVLILVWARKDVWFREQ